MADDEEPTSTDEELSSPRAAARQVAKEVRDLNATSYKQAPFKLRIPSVDDMASASPRQMSPRFSASPTNMPVRPPVPTLPQ
jgi:hypothetical protein